MPRIFCVHCGIPVVVDPQGRCPEGHIPDRTGEPGPGELGRALDAPSTSSQGPGDVARIDLEDALRAVAGPPAGSEAGPVSAQTDAPPAITGDDWSAGQTDQTDDDEPQPWVWDVATAAGEADDWEADGGEAAPDVDLFETPSDSDQQTDNDSEPAAPVPTPPAFDGDLDLFDGLDDLGAPGSEEVVTPGNGDGAGDDDGLSFLFDAEPRGGEDAPDGEPAAETRPIPIVAATDTSRAATPGLAIDPTNYTSRGGRVDDSSGGGGWRARLGRRRVS